MALQSLRKASSTWIFKALLIFLALSFAAFFGVSGNPFRRVASLITVDDVNIDIQEMNTEYNRLLQSLSDRLGSQINPDRAQREGLLEQTIRMIVTRTLLDVAARDVDVIATDAQIRRIIRGSTQFQSAGGQFDKMRFDNYLRVNGYSEPEFIEIIRGSLERGQYTEALRAGAASPRTLTQTLLRYREEQRMATVVELRESNITLVEEPSSIDIDTYYADHPREFTAPEYRSVTSAFLAPSDLAKEILVQEDEIAAAFELRRGRFEEPERREIEQVVFASNDEASAHKLLALVNQGQDFAEATAQTTEASALISLGKLTRDELPIAELANTAFKLEAGAVSEPVATDFGWHVMRVRTIEPGITKSLDDLHDILANELALEQARAEIFDVLNGVDDALAAGASIEDVARDSKLNSIRLDALARNGSTRDGHAVGIPEDPLYLETVFGTPEGQESQVLETTDGGFFVIRVDRIIDPRLHTLPEIRDQVIQNWQAEQRRLRIEESAHKIAERVRLGEELITIAEEFGLTVTTSEPMTRSGKGAKSTVSRAAVSDLFTIRKGEVTVVPVPGGAQVVRLVEIMPADTSGDKVDILGEELVRAIANDLEFEMATALDEHYDIVIDRDTINDLFQTP